MKYTRPTRTPSTPDASAERHPIELVEVETGFYLEPLAVGIYGLPGTGKSAFCGTAPGKIGLMPFEKKSRQTVLKVAAQYNRGVVMPEIDLIRQGNPMIEAMLLREDEP